MSTGFPDEWAIWNSRPAELEIDGRETLAQLQGRVLEGMRAIQQARPGRSILVVTHVAVIRVISLFADKQELNRYKKVPVDNASVFHFTGLGRLDQALWCGVFRLEIGVNRTSSKTE